jgi:hypothetical protein
LITDATVSASYFNSQGQPIPRANREFWLADGVAALKVFFPVERGDLVPPFSVKVGQRISFRARAVTNFNGIPEITDVDPLSWALESEENPVYIEDRTGDSFSGPDINHVVRVTGTLGQTATACGGNYFCYALDHGAAQPVTLRTNSQFIMPGDCVTFVGPVAAFGGDLQLNAINFDWLRAPFR